MATGLLHTWIARVREAIDHLHELNVVLWATIIGERGYPTTPRRNIDRSPLAPSCLVLQSPAFASSRKHSPTLSNLPERKLGTSA